ncbi:hypothetical protein DB32_001458 [Sandaracinus amylolyticus]|uniref:Uncharacterized protein n=1 Tax=Sandaracinus amylolyticus TaxID=927083 RepID=A0A0F6SDZ6_9BACT|nr:hypothetical protein DB32_001458 [Sandaracinus amylolyticus]
MDALEQRAHEHRRQTEAQSGRDSIVDEREKPIGLHHGDSGAAFDLGDRQDHPSSRRERLEQRPIRVVDSAPQLFERFRAHRDRSSRR